MVFLFLGKQILKIRVKAVPKWVKISGKAVPVTGHKYDSLKNINEFDRREAYQ